MKKKIMIGLIAAVVGCSFVGCASLTYIWQDQNKSIEYNDFGFVDGYGDTRSALIYNKQTKIVYWRFISGFAPYISKEGTYCKYENGKVVPLEKGE